MRIRGSVLTLAAFLLAQVSTAWASTFTVNPIQLVLSGRTTSGLLTLRNTSTETLRFQLNTYSWDQSPLGEMVLAPSGDLVFFPQLLMLAPGEERNVRIGAAIAPGPVEKTYRIFIEELPPRQRSLAPPGSEVRILTRMSIPIFVRPTKALAAGRIETMAVKQRRLAFQIKNGGTVHFVVQTILITGNGASGQPVLSRELQGWYLLAGGTRLYDLELPPGECERLRSLTVKVQTTDKTLTERLEVSPSACAP